MKKLFVLLLGVSCSAMAMERVALYVRYETARPAEVSTEQWAQINELVETSKCLFPVAIYKVLGQYVPFTTKMTIGLAKSIGPSAATHAVRNNATTSERFYLVKSGLEKQAKNNFTVPVEESFTVLQPGDEENFPKINGLRMVVCHLCEFDSGC